MKRIFNEEEFPNTQYPDKELTYEIIGLAMGVHKYFGNGLSEVLYKDALEQEFKTAGIDYEREKRYDVEYKGIVLPHYYFADFVVNDKLILEVKAQEGVLTEAVPQVINYLSIAKLRLGLLVNFGEQSLKFRRVLFDRK